MRRSYSFCWVRSKGWIEAKQGISLLKVVSCEANTKEPLCAESRKVLVYAEIYLCELASDNRHIRGREQEQAIVNPQDGGAVGDVRGLRQEEFIACGKEGRDLVMRPAHVVLFFFVFGYDDFQKSSWKGHPNYLWASRSLRPVS